MGVSSRFALQNFRLDMSESGPLAEVRQNRRTPAFCQMVCLFLFGSARWRRG
jgi:hypothetical protein